MKPKIELVIKNGGSAFNGNTLNTARPIGQIKDSKEKHDHLNVVKLTAWCSKNFISRDIGYTLLKLRLLIGFRRHHIWWVAANPNCKDELLEYLNLEELFFDADNSDFVVDP